MELAGTTIHVSDYQQQIARLQKAVDFEEDDGARESSVVGVAPCLYRRTVDHSSASVPEPASSRCQWLFKFPANDSKATNTSRKLLHHKRQPRSGRSSEFVGVAGKFLLFLVPLSVRYSDHLPHQLGSFLRCPSWKSTTTLMLGILHWNSPPPFLLPVLFFLTGDFSISI